MDTAYIIPSNRHIVAFCAADATRLAIVDAVDEPVDTITVQHICEGCGISRGTFYNHFHSKYDIQPWFVQTVMEKTVDQVGRTVSWTQGIADYLYVLSCKERFNRCAGSRPEACDVLERHRRVAIAKTLETYRGMRLTKGQRLLVDHYVESEVRLCVRWFSGGLPNDLDALCDLFESSVPLWLHDALELPGRALVGKGAA